jgi:sensor histidine kinase YesM
MVWFYYSYFFGFNSTNESYINWFSSILIPITIINTYISIYYLIPYFLIKKRYGLFLLYGFYTLIGSAYVINIAIFFGYMYLSDFDLTNMPPLSRSLPFILMSMYLVVIVVSAFKLGLHNYQSLEKNKALENKFLQTQLQLKEEELKFLKMQIHPHFLFNTLNSIYGLALQKSATAPEMILKLSNLLDYILYQINKPLVPLEEELNHIADYIALEKMRFSDTLQISFEQKGKTELFQIAPMLLIPFIENSFKHGSIINNVLTINIRVEAQDDVLVFNVKNSVLSTENTAKGIGLKNIKKRLKMLYPRQYDLDIEQNSNTFEVSLRLYKESI